MKDTNAIDQERQRRGAELAADMRDAMSFPPLPPSPVEVGDLILQMREYVQSLGWGNREQLYTASQVRSMISAAVAAERERCADKLMLKNLALINAASLLKLIEHADGGTYGEMHDVLDDIAEGLRA